MTGGIDRDRVVEAFDAAVDYWHEQIDNQIDDHADNESRPDTARQYFEDYRGFDAATIDEWRLGWAPGDGELYELLTEQGFADDVIAATGLFCESNPEKELWRGRYVLPYFAADGRAEYAIARCTGSKGGGAAGYDGHSNDFLAGKYAKVAHTRDNVPLSEPILGLHTLADADEVVIAEGIADAISAQEAGYAVLSPVTKEFKQEHFEVVVDAIDEHAIERAYVVPDAEIAGFAEIDSDDVPDEPENIYEAINLPTVAPGPGGGLRTANYLQEQGVDARLVELPQPSAGKVDLDDYLQGWADGLDAPLLSSNPPVEHPQYDAATATQDTEASGGNVSTTEDETRGQTPSTSTGGSSASGLFSLDVGDVNGDLEDGYRGRNPLGHTGDSENYFVVNKHPESEDLIAKDYKRPGNPRYTGCTYLLVELEERPVEGPMGELSPRETWIAWAEARERGLLTEDDVIPEKALRYIARDRDLYNFDALPEGTDELPPKACNRALWWLNERWADENLPEDEDATARRGKTRNSVVLTWEDVRYIYEDSKEHGRKAARELLSDRYHFMTLADGATLQVYDPETGIFTDRTGDVRGEIYEELGEHWSTHELNEILAGLRQQSVVQPRHVDAGDRDEPLICVANGVLNVFERELHDHSPDYHFVNRVPVEYDPEAETETYTEFVGDLVDREDRKQALFEMVGHALLPDANSRYKNFLILSGDADNGKSMFYDCVSTLLNGPDGQENNTAAVKLAKLAQNRFSLNSMYGSLANIAGEIDGKKIRNTANLKDITGGDEVEIEPKGSDSFFDEIGTTLMFAANDPPILGERDKEAIASRIVPVELPYTFVNDPNGEYEKERVPENELRSELEDPEALSGFLNLALDGLERLEENDGDVSLKESPKKRLELYERSADPMREFGTVALQNDPDDYVVKADIVTLYKEFATQQGYEVGSSVEKVLHHALRGLPDLNYTDSQPREPDYTDTSLPLQGWDSRKRVVNRVTLTEEGMELAESAGLVEETDDTADEAAGVVSVDEITPKNMVDNAMLPTIRATVAGVWENQYGTKVGELQGDHTTVDIRFVGASTFEKPVEEGATYEFDGLRARNPADERGYIEHRPTTEAELIEHPDGDDYDPGEFESIGDPSDGGGEEDGGATITGEGSYEEGMADEAATDGGDSGESESIEADTSTIKGRVLEYLRVNTESGDTITTPNVAGEIDDNPDDVRAALRTIANNRSILKKGTSGTYEVL